MANISDAHGAVYLEGEWNPEQIKAISYLLFTQETGYYNTIWSLHEFKEFLNELQKEFSMTYIANGRWAFAVNLEMLDKWYKIGEERWKKDVVPFLGKDYMLTYAEYLDLCQWVIDEMVDHELTLAWEYYDMEPGCSFMCYAEGQHKAVFDPGELRSSLVYTENIIENWDCNLKNQCEQFFEGEYDQLGEVVDQLTRLYRLPEEREDAIEALIKSHPTWYDIPAYPYFEKRTQFPKELRTEIIKRIKGVVPW